MKFLLILLSVLVLFAQLYYCLKFSLPALPANYVGNRRCIILNFGVGELITGMVKSDKANMSAFRTNAWVLLTCLRIKVAKFIFDI